VVNSSCFKLKILIFILLFSSVSYAELTADDTVDLITIIYITEGVERKCESNNYTKFKDSYKRWYTENQVHEIKSYLEANFPKIVTAMNATDRLEAIKDVVTSLYPAVCTKFDYFYRDEKFNPLKLKPELAVLLTNETDNPTLNQSTALPKGKKIQSVTDEKLAELLVIDKVILDSGTRMGIGGALTMTMEPIVLLKDGSASTDTSFIPHVLNLKKHQAAYPEKWTTWKKVGAKYQINTKKGWQDVSFNEPYLALPENQKIEGKYEAYSGGGNSAVGGSAGMVRISNVEFSKDGRFLEGKFTAHTSTHFDNRFASAYSDDGRGAYFINGYLLTLAYENGHIKIASIVYSSKNERAIWLDDKVYFKE